MMIIANVANLRNLVVSDKYDVISSEVNWNILGRDLVSAFWGFKA
jgi:hypothetical protein